jgi:hypothetical protein
MTPPSKPPPFQFGLRSLFGAMSAAAMLVGVVVRAWPPSGTVLFIAFFCTIVVVALLSRTTKTTSGSRA